MDESKPWFKDVLKIAQPDKSPGVRSAVRFPLQLSVILIVDGRELEAKTENVSANGISLWVAERVMPGQEIRFRLKLQGEVLGTTKDVLVTCEGRVVRCEAVDDAFQVAATIDAYQFSEP